MRLQRAMPALAAAITLAGSAAPAYAFDNRAPEIGPNLNGATTLVSHTRSTGSNDALVDIGAGLVAGMAIGSIGFAAYTGRTARGTAKAGRVATGRS
jgi:hypothetical protein